MTSTIFPILNPFQGLVILAVYTILALVLTTVFSRGYGKTKESFLLANRKLGFFQGTVSVTAAIIWAPAMFISCLQGYVNGFSGFFWMFMGNLFALILFGYFTPKIKDMYPNGFTLSGLMRKLYGPRVQVLFLVELFLLLVGALSVNIMAGAMAIYTISGINYHLLTMIIPVIALSYTLRGGLKASIITEIIKVAIFMTVWLGLTFWAISLFGGMPTVWQGFGGKTGLGTTLFGNQFAINALIGFGIPTVLSLLSATWADNTFYQRLFAIEKTNVRRSFITAAFVSVSVTVFGGLIGMLAAGARIVVPNKYQTYTNIYLFGMSMPHWVYPVLLFVVFASLVSIIDSQIGTASSLAGDDIYNLLNDKVDEKKILLYSRAAMLIVASVVVAVVNIPGITLLEIFLLYGLSRATVWIPTMITILNQTVLSEFGMFWGIVLAWLIGLPLYVYGAMMGGGNAFILSGTLMTIFGSAAIGLTLTAIDRAVKPAII
jgi:Na+/proline symporter